MPKENISDRNGRALEYKIIDFLCGGESSFKVTLTSRGKVDQLRDRRKFLSLPEGLKESYEKTVPIVHDWLLKIIIGKEIEIDRLSDNEAKKGDVTDIRISEKGREVNLSIKHNHSALKHQRPPTTVLWCGYTKRCKEDLAFRGKYKKVIESFLSETRKVLPKASLFRELSVIDSGYIKNKFYLPVCSLVAKTIEELCLSPKRTEALFNFLVGKTTFYKIIDEKDRVRILDFTNVDIPKKVDVKLRDKSYVDLYFSNGWKVGMRLHTASSRLGTSLKFDTQAISLPGVKEIIIKK